MASDDVVVVTGAGGMGSAIARRIGAGSMVVLADLDEQLLDREAAGLRVEGYAVTSHVVDVARKESVDALAAAASDRGAVKALVHTVECRRCRHRWRPIIRVDLLGTALVLDAFGAVISRGGAGVCICSMAGTMWSLDPELELRLAQRHRPTSCWICPSSRRTRWPIPASPMAWPSAPTRYQSRRVARLGERGARVNSISPGVISTPMGEAELDGPHGDIMRAMIAGSGSGRVGTADDIAAAVEFLLGPNADFITGTDLLVDGGVIASLFAAVPERLIAEVALWVYRSVA